jgi:DNA-directed RNA polymerase specialized sigma24 family protein
MSRTNTTEGSQTGLDGDSALFDSRFRRSYQLMHLIACRVLGGPEQADTVIENCWVKASRNPPRFEYEGAFRSWLLRVLIDEALAVLRERHRKVKRRIARRPAPTEVFPEDDISDGESNPKIHQDQVSRGFSVALE